MGWDYITGITVAATNSEKPNLVCPECEGQYDRAHLNRLDFQTIRPFETRVTCPYCNIEVHPEDAFTAYLQHVPEQQWTGIPFSIGAFANSDTATFEVGKAHEVGLIGVGGDFEVGEIRLWDISDAAGIPSDKLDESVVRAHTGPIEVNKLVVVDAVPLGGGEIGFITSLKDGESENPPMEVEVGYHNTIHLANMNDPAWIELMREASSALHSANFMAVLPLLSAAFENHLYRQLYRTMRYQGKSEDKIEEIFNECRRGRHLSWEETVKHGLKTVTGTNMIANEYHSAYDSYLKFKRQRDNAIVHIGYDEEAGQIFTEEAVGYFNTTIDAIVTVFEICQKGR